MIGTVEALGVFLLAVLPGFAALRTYGFGNPPFRATGALHELGTMVVWSLLGWVVLYLWRGQDLLPIVLDGDRRLAVRIDAFAELAILAISIGVACGLVARLVSAAMRVYAVRKEPGSLVQEVKSEGFGKAIRTRARRRGAHELHIRALPTRAWDRLFARLSKEQRSPVLCRVQLCEGGGEVLGVLARDGFADWKADGGDLLLTPQVVRDEAGKLHAVPTSRGVFIPSGQIAMLSVVELPKEALSSNDDG